MRRPSVVLAALVISGCPEPDVAPCTEFEEVFVWSDADGDGFGGDAPIGYVCVPSPDEATNDADCDDGDPTIHPGAAETCDLKDNDCNDRVDETEAKLPWYPDADGDGFGGNTGMEFACTSPGAGWLESPGDCNDDSADINPLAIEVCNGGLDDDCDTLADDADGGVDPTTYSPWYRDQDGDTYGDPSATRLACAPPLGAVADGSDCDDDELTINPGAIEICDRIDNDCDALVDDEDDSVDPATQDQFFADNDGDGYGDAANLTLACESVPGYGVSNDDDCDDTDPLAYVDQWWGLDFDADGAGDGQQLVFQCLSPGAGMAPEGNGIDCEPTDPAIFPLQTEDCFDGVDQDCDLDVDCVDADCASEPTCMLPCADDLLVEAVLPLQTNGSTVGRGNDTVPNCLGGGGASDWAFHFIPAQTRLYTMNTIGSNYDTSLYVRTGCNNVELACNDDWYGLQSRVQVNLQAGVPVLVIVDGYSNNEGNFVLNIF